MTYVIRNANSMALPLLAGFDTLEDAQHALAALEVIEGENPAGAIRFTIETLESYGNAAQHHFKASNRLASEADSLRAAITKHLDAVEGAMDVEEFIAEHQDLADAIGYEFEEETTFRITLEVVVKHQMGKTDLDDALDIEVKEFNGYGDSGIIDIDVTDIDIRKQ